jgi:hypothetical protein
VKVPQHRVELLYDSTKNPLTPSEFPETFADLATHRRQRNLRSSPTRVFNSSALIAPDSVAMPQDSHAQTAAKREKCDSRKPFATTATRRHLAGLAVHTARVSGEPWLRTPLLVRMSSVAISISAREKTNVSPPRVLNSIVVIFCSRCLRSGDA